MSLQTGRQSDGRLTIAYRHSVERRAVKHTIAYKQF